MGVEIFDERECEGIFDIANVKTINIKIYKSFLVETVADQKNAVLNDLELNVKKHISMKMISSKIFIHKLLYDFP